MEQVNEKFPEVTVGCQAICDSTCRDVGALACSMTLPGAGADQVDSLKMVGLGQRNEVKAQGVCKRSAVRGNTVFARSKGTEDLESLGLEVPEKRKA